MNVLNLTNYEIMDGDRVIRTIPCALSGDTLAPIRGEDEIYMQLVLSVHGEVTITRVRRDLI